MKTLYQHLIINPGVKCEECKRPINRIGLARCSASGIVRKLICKKCRKAK